MFDLKDATAGSNLPPMHPFCRSTTLPVLPDEEELDRQIKETGDEIGVDVSFDEWQKNLVETEDGKLIYRVDKAEKSGIINTKIRDGKVVNPMDLQKYQIIKSNLENQGIHVIHAVGDDLRYLEQMGAEASYGNGYILHIGETPSASALFEEIIHYSQEKKYGVFISSDPKELYAREIAANRMLLKNGKAYGFDNMDFDEISQNLSYWEKKFEKEVGIPYDKSDIKREI